MRLRALTPETEAEFNEIMLGATRYPGGWLRPNDGDVEVDFSLRPLLADDLFKAASRESFIEKFFIKAGSLDERIRVAAEEAVLTGRGHYFIAFDEAGVDNWGPTRDELLLLCPVK